MRGMLLLLVACAGCTGVERPEVVNCGPVEVARGWSVRAVWQDSGECVIPEDWRFAIPAEAGIYVIAGDKGPGHAAILGEPQIARGERADVQTFRPLRIPRVAYSVGRVPRVAFVDSSEKPVFPVKSPYVDYLRVRPERGAPVMLAYAGHFVATLEKDGHGGVLRILDGSTPVPRQVAEVPVGGEDGVRLSVSDAGSVAALVSGGGPGARLLRFAGDGGVLTDRAFELDGTPLELLALGDRDIAVVRSGETGLLLLPHDSPSALRFELPAETRALDVRVAVGRILVATLDGGGVLRCASVALDGGVRQAELGPRRPGSIQIVPWGGRVFLVGLHDAAPLVTLDEIEMPDEGR